MKEFFDAIDKAILPMSWNDILQWLSIAILFLSQKFTR